MAPNYWNLYVLYIERCVRENYENDIDPNHYEMEWNHFWPESIFGDWPVGQWLTLRQHAVASALQTVVFRENCMFSTHKSYLPLKLLELAWPYYCKAMKKNGAKGAVAGNLEKDENGKSINAVKRGKKGAAVTNKIIHAEKDENGKSLLAKRLGAMVHAEKDENGKSLLGLKCAAVTHSERDENGKSVNAVKGAAVTNSQRWQSAVDGFISNAGNVARHNRANGWPGDARVRLS